MSQTTKIIIYLVEFIIAVALISFSLNWFLVYAFMVLLINMDRHTDFIRKLTRVFQVSNQIRLNAIQYKLKITDEEIKKVTEDTLKELSESQRLELDKDFADLHKS